MNIKHLSKCLGICATGMLLLLPSTRAAAYDPAADFSLNSNPNGVWSYGYSMSLGGAMTLHQETDANWRGTGVYARLTTSGNGLGAYYNPSDSPATYAEGSNYLLWGPHAFSLHPGQNGEYGMLRFTAPTGGLFEIQGRWYSVDQYYGASTDVHILKNGVAIFNDTMLGKTDTSDFSTSVQLAAGETLDFAVGPYLYGHGWDNTGLTLSLTPVPEPSLLGLLIIGLGWLRCHRLYPCE